MCTLDYSIFLRWFATLDFACRQWKKPVVLKAGWFILSTWAPIFTRIRRTRHWGAPRGGQPSAARGVRTLVRAAPTLVSSLIYETCGGLILGSQCYNLLNP